MDSEDQGAGRTGDQPLGPHAASLLATEHWSLIAERSLIWNEAQSRATMFLTVLSAAGVALALAANNAGFGVRTTTVALVLLPVVFLLGIAAYVRLVQLNAAEFLLVLAMNRLRRAYLTLEPGIERYLSTGSHDDEPGLFATYMVDRPTRRSLHLILLVSTPTVVATIDAALAAAMAVLSVHAADAPVAVAAVGAAAAFVLVWAALFLIQRQAQRPLRDYSPRFPTPPDQRLSDAARPPTARPEPHG
jgi:uncharacterized membrane protein